jgi:hypothetical protein
LNRTILKSAKLPQLLESLVRPGYETLTISAWADADRLALHPRRKLAWFCYAPLADFSSAVDTALALRADQEADAQCDG